MKTTRALALVALIALAPVACDSGDGGLPADIPADSQTSTAGDTTPQPATADAPAPDVAALDASTPDAAPAAEPPAAERPSAEVAAVAWGEQDCASCRMVVGVPRFAAQATTSAGEWLAFDDLGCLVIEMGTGRLDPTDVFFRHVDEDRWLRLADAGFVRRDGTPMGFGFGVVDAADGELSFAEIGSEMGGKFGFEWPPARLADLATDGELGAGLAAGTPVRDAVVEASCGQCQFDLEGAGCDLAIRVGDQAWYVDGTGIDDHGDAHADDGFCNAVLPAKVSGQVVDGRFAATAFALTDG